MTCCSATPLRALVLYADVVRELAAAATPANRRTGR